MDKRRKERVKESYRSQSDADGIDDEGAVEVLQDDSAAVFSNADGLYKLCQVIADQDDIGTLASDIRTGAHGHAPRWLRSAQAHR